MHQNIKFYNEVPQRTVAYRESAEKIAAIEKLKTHTSSTHKSTKQEQDYLLLPQKTSCDIMEVPSSIDFLILHVPPIVEQGRV